MYIIKYDHELELLSLLLLPSECWEYRHAQSMQSWGWISGFCAWKHVLYQLNYSPIPCGPFLPEYSKL